MSRGWWWPIALPCLALAVAVPVGARAVAGPQGAVVHVRWQDAESADERQRAALESRFRLTDGQLLEGTTWRYVLRDPSSANVRALIADPSVDDTHHIDRREGTVASSATRMPRQGQLLVSGDTLVRFADGIALLLAAFIALVGTTAWAGAQSWRAAAGLVQVRVARRSAPAVTTAVSVARWMSRGIPELSARTAGIFRVIFGVAVLIFFALHPEGMPSLTAMFDPLIYSPSHATVLDWLRAHPAVVNALTTWLLVTGAAFTIGLLTRLSYTLFVAGAVTWAFVAVSHDSTHPNSTLVMTLVALLPSRWGDAFSVDSLLRRSASPRPHVSARRYGYSVWVPGLVFGVAFAAAAWAKIARSGVDWVLNGSVKYHFVTDSLNAPVQWGLTLAGHPWVAVVASLGAVLVELLVITAAFTRHEWYRATMGVAGLALLGGFWLFMGVLWPAWWILFLGFLPWQHFDRWLGRSSAAGGIATAEHALSTATVAQLAAVAFVLGQQVVISTLAIERAPMFTNYPMYSWTFASTDQFDAYVRPYYRIVVATHGGDVELACNASEDLVEEFQEALRGSSGAAESIWASVHGCRRDITGARDVRLEGDRRVFDWKTLEFTTTRAAIVLGPLPSTN